ncbi:hypothetical protein [Bradyrhizobium sp. 76]|uniref:hypothetical protein n=1 Tax=Bradyrhizobium sp. 76 TaxID=2782680 RepID=UPI001FF7E4E0|nr:hypothetical protein [Bradyrhizobium sp. 76]MCK1405297.1 hypothetical protein [Bradyrhizobium sp. 76]
MERTLARKRGSPVGIADVVEDLRARAKSLAKASYYLYRATVLQRIRDLFAEGVLDEEGIQKLVARLTPEDGTASIGTCVPEKRTSAQSRKHVRAVSFSTLAFMSYAKKTRTYVIVGAMMEYGPDLVTRPCELIGGIMTGRWLSIRAAKCTNGRGVGEIRNLGLKDAFTDFDLEEVRDLLTLLREDLQKVGGDRSKLVRRYGAALRRLRQGVSWAKGITLKSTRAQGRANLARAGYTAFEIASIMGHASAETSASHYGRKSQGWKSSHNRRPLAISERALGRVRPGARTKAKIARGQPLTFSEARDAFAGPKPA